MKIKCDTYKKSRGRSYLLELRCRECDALVCHYQKDGPGNLRRLYLDRIIDPAVSIHTKQLQCPGGHPLAILITYAKEKRLAYRLFVDALIKKRCRW